MVTRTTKYKCIKFKFKNSDKNKSVFVEFGVTIYKCITYYLKF